MLQCVAVCCRCILCIVLTRVAVCCSVLQFWKFIDSSDMMDQSVHMGWLWLVGSIELYVCFAKEPYKRDDILYRRPIILSILQSVATPQYKWTHLAIYKQSSGTNALFDPSLWGPKSTSDLRYVVATISRLPKNIGLFCQWALLKRLYSEKETYVVKDPTNHSHPIVI